MTRAAAAKKATQADQDLANQKLESSFFMMQLSGTKINAHSLAKEARVHRATATKFLKRVYT